MSIKVLSEGARLEAAGVETYGCCQAWTVGMSTLGVGAGGLGASGPIGCGRKALPLSTTFRGIPVDDLDRAHDFCTKVLGMEYLSHS